MSKHIKSNVCRGEEEAHVQATRRAYLAMRSSQQCLVSFLTDINSLFFAVIFWLVVLVHGDTRREKPRKSFDTPKKKGVHHIEEGDGHLCFGRQRWKWGQYKQKLHPETLREVTRFVVQKSQIQLKLHAPQK